MMQSELMVGASEHKGSENMMRTTAHDQPLFVPIYAPRVDATCKPTSAETRTREGIFPVRQARRFTKGKCKHVSSSTRT